MSHSTRQRALRAATTAALSLTLIGATTQSASAAVNVSISIGPYVSIYDLSGVVNDLEVTGSGKTYTVRSLNGGPIVATSATCANTSSTVVKCTNNVNVTGVWANLGNGSDRLTYTGVTVKGTVHAGAGNDTISGGSGPDYFVGEAGNDTLTGNGGDDTMAGSIGDDRVTGGNGNDGLAGNDGADTLFGSLGNDTIVAGTGVDTVYGDNVGDLLSGGNDTIDVRNGDNDSTECAGGIDTVKADILGFALLDWYVGVGFSCETVTRG